MKLFITMEKQELVAKTLLLVAKSFGAEEATSANDADLIICDDPHKIRDMLMDNQLATAIEYHTTMKETPSRLCETGHPLEGRVVPGYVLTEEGHPSMVIEIIKRLATPA